MIWFALGLDYLSTVGGIILGTENCSKLGTPVACFVQNKPALLCIQNC